MRHDFDERIETGQIGFGDFSPSFRGVAGCLHDMQGIGDAPKAKIVRTLMLHLKKVCRWWRGLVHAEGFCDRPRCCRFQRSDERRVGDTEARMPQRSPPSCSRSTKKQPACGFEGRSKARSSPNHLPTRHAGPVGCKRRAVNSGGKAPSG